MREPAPGDKLDQFQLSQLIARSGMASIFKAIDTETGQTVALKIPHMQFESDVVFYERFRREEEIGQKLDHPNLTKVLRPRNKSRMYVAMEFVEGKSLRQILQEEGKLPPARAIAIARQICEAIAYLHEQGVVHRDLKPENIVLTPSGSIKILDFGIALDQSARRLTWYKLSATVGTPDYIAPEQVAGKRGDARTDVYAVGTILYEMLTGHLPFTADNPLALMAAKTKEDPRPPSYYLPDIDPAIEGIILRSLERSPRDRQNSAKDLLEELRNPAAVPPWTPGASRRRRAPMVRRLFVGLAALAIVAALASLIWLSSRRSPEVPAPPADSRPR